MRFRLAESEIKEALMRRMAAHSSPITNEQIDIWFEQTFLDAMADMSKIAAAAAARSRDAQAHISWFTLDFAPDIIVHLWALRECILARSLYEAGKTMDFPIYANILGSTTLLSDIDVTIESRHSSRAIEFIEDLWAGLHWFDHDAWRVDLYGDFTMIGDFYMNMYRLDKDAKRELLELATASYLRHHNSSDFKKGVLERLIHLASPDTGVTSEAILSAAKNIMHDIDELESDVHRQRYYKLLEAAEILHDAIYESVQKTTPAIQNETLVGMVGSVLIHLARANLYREENYVLPSTVVHVVRIEQGSAHDDYDTSCSYILTKIAKCSLDGFAYLLSAIEQLGYMQAHLLDETCSLPAGKYFGRFLRALQASHISINERAFLAATEVSRVLADEKRERGERGDIDYRCTSEADLYAILEELFVTGGKRSTRRRRRATRKRKMPAV